jgi:2-C-methyl-D-erythritol 4-phosphate cytidylyltransferase
MASAAAYWAVVPAAGVGRRMAIAFPKQYLELKGQTILEHTLGRLLDHPQIRGVCVAISAVDTWWPKTRFVGHPGLRAVTGGSERPHSVLRALDALAGQAPADDWVLVHDAVRPCVRAADIDRLVSTLSQHPVGGLLGVPVRDTLKRADAQGRLIQTVDREGLWHALTPQMFRLGELRLALRRALAAGCLVTDEASAMELAGWQPQMVPGHPDNIKITRMEDLALASFFLEHQASAC